MAVIQSDEGGSNDFTDIHSKRGGVFRSEDGGENWKRTSDLNPRPFYFSQIRIDPANDQRVYLLGFALLASDDGGKTFREDLSDKVASGHARTRHSKWKRAATETAKAGTRPGTETTKAADLVAFDYWERWRRLPKLCWRQRLGAFESNSCGRVLPHLIRRLAADLPDRRWLAG